MPEQDPNKQHPNGAHDQPDQSGPTIPPPATPPEAATHGPADTADQGSAPSTRPTTRASDSDRDTVLSILGAAMANGRLDQAEYDTRSSAALAARTLGDLETLTADLPEAETHAREQRHAEQRRKDLKHRAMQWRSWLGTAIILNTIWLISSISQGRADDYWPAYPLGIWAAILLSHTLKSTRNQPPHP